MLGWRNAIRNSALVATLVGLAGCSHAQASGTAANADTEDKAAVLQAVHSKFDGQVVLIMPFEPTNPACAADPLAMDRATFASCIHSDPASLPDDLALTKDVAAFDLDAKSPVILVLQTDPNDPHSWEAITALGPLPDTGSLVANSVNVQPRIIPFLIAGGVALLEGGEAAVAMNALMAGAIAFFGGKAVVQTAQMLSQHDAAAPVKSTQSAMDNVVQSTGILSGAEAKARAQLDDQVKKTSSDNWIAAAACVEGGTSVSTPRWGTAKTEEGAKAAALDQASNYSNMPPQNTWDDEDYCRVLFTCHKNAAGALLPCSNVTLLPK